MTDYHCHLLPGIDDGPKTLEQSVRMAALLSEAGFSHVHCTPHMIRNVYDATTQEVFESIEFLQKELDRQGIELHLLGGREYCLDEHFTEYIDALVPLEGTGYLLVEIPPGVSQAMVMEGMAAIMNKGLKPMIAHPERCPMLTEESPKGLLRSLSTWLHHPLHEKMSLKHASQSTSLLECLISLDCAFQGNLGNLMGYYSKKAFTAFNRFKRQGLYSHAGTDAHSPEFLVSMLMLSKISGMFTLDDSARQGVQARTCAC